MSAAPIGAAPACKDAIPCPTAPCPIPVVPAA